MTEDSKPTFTAGDNIAIKVPAHQFADTVSFYRDVLGLPEKPGSTSDSKIFQFGDKNLWIDKVENLQQAETWLEIITDDIKLAASYLATKGVTRCDEVEVLPDGLKGFWVASPTNGIHLIHQID